MSAQAGAVTRSRFSWLVVGRVLWSVVIALSLLSFLASIPAGYERFSRVCVEVPSRTDIGDTLGARTETSPCLPGQLGLEGARSLARAGLTVSFYALYNALIYGVFVTVYVTVALVIFWRRSDDVMALFVSLTLVIFGVFVPEFVDALRDLDPAWELVTAVLASIGWIVFPLLFYLFPDGQFVPRWTRYLAVIWIAIQVPPYLLIGKADSPLLMANWPVAIQAVLLASLFGSCLYAQVYRYRRVPGTAQRQQTKWIVFGMIVAIASLILLYLPETLFPDQFRAQPLYRLIVDTLSALALLLIPLTISVAILRYRLWDIDILINRALVYAVLTALLLAIYLGGIFASQELSRVLMNHQSNLASVVVTLICVALFNPLQRRVQGVIDQRFYRRKYDVEQMLTAFSERVRDQFDIQQVTQYLLETVHDTMQPMHITLIWPDRSEAIFAQTLVPGAIQPVTVPVSRMDAGDALMRHFRQNHGAVDVKKFKLQSPVLQALRQIGVDLAVPLLSQGEVIGILNLGPRLSEQEYSSLDHQFLTRLATQAAPAVRVARLVEQQRAETVKRERIDQEMRVAQLIQQMLLPRHAPIVEGWEFAGHYQPAEAVGGDFYDFLHFEDGQIGLLVGDVTDKGMPAALVMATTRSLLRSVGQRVVSPGRVLEQVNNLLHPDIPAGMFVTCLYAVLDPVSGRLRYANAGHNLPFRVLGESVQELWATGMPLGLLPGMNYEEHETTIAPGESLLLYSDGLVEAHNPLREMFGSLRIQAILNEVPGGPLLIERLLHELAAFVGPEGDQEDDVTLVTVQRRAD